MDAGTRLVGAQRGLPPAESRSVATVLASMNVHSLLDLGPDASRDEVEVTVSAIRVVWTSVLVPDGAGR